MIDAFTRAPSRSQGTEFSKAFLTMHDQEEFVPEQMGVFMMFKPVEIV